MIQKKNTNRKPEPKLNGVELYEGVSLMENLKRMKQNGEKPKIQADMIYTEKKKGVIPAYNIRTDRFEIGQDNAEKIAAYKNAKAMREQNAADPNNKEEETIEVKENVSEQK